MCYHTARDNVLHELTTNACERYWSIVWWTVSIPLLLYWWIGTWWVNSFKMHNYLEVDCAESLRVTDKICVQILIFHTCNISWIWHLNRFYFKISSKYHFLWKRPLSLWRLQLHAIFALHWQALHVRLLIKHFQHKQLNILDLERVFFIHNSGMRMVGTECIRNVLFILPLGAPGSVHSGIWMRNKRTSVFHILAILIPELWIKKRTPSSNSIQQNVVLPCKRRIPERKLLSLLKRLQNTFLHEYSNFSHSEQQL